MYTIKSTANKVSANLAKAIKALSPNLLVALRAAAIKINQLTLDNLAGSHKADPGSYPVPNRTGNLFRHQDWAPAAGSMAMFVFNDARYARAIHEGTDSSSRYGRRPFLDDAVEKSDFLTDIQNSMRGSFSI